MLNEPNALWSRVLRHKYCKGRCDIDMFTPSPGCSNVWRGITDNAKWIKQGSSVAVGNGVQTLFWDHIWAMEESLRDHIIQPIPAALDGATVEELLVADQGWKWDLLENLLPTIVLKKIASHQLVEDPSVGDLIYWKGSKSGGFSIRYALKIIRDESLEMSDKKWNLIWTAPVQQRIRMFLWILMHDRVLSNANRVKRHLSDDPSCPKCDYPEETLLHLLRDCPGSRAIWLSFSGTTSYSSFFQGDLSSWLCKNLNAEGLIYSDKWPTAFATTLWWIWRWRNDIVFNQGVNIPLHTRAFLHRQIDEVWAVFSQETTIDQHLNNINKQLVYVRWTAPAANWIVLNTDGASRGASGLSGGGGILRDCSGQFLGAFSANFGSCSAYKAELMAIARGLDMAKSLNIPRLEVQMDNEACLNVLSNTENQGGECFHIVNHCRALINFNMWSIKLVHCFREANKVADKLANLGVDQVENYLYYHHPFEEIASLLRDDCMGVTSPRLII